MQLTEAIWAVRDFIELGGNVLLVIAFVTGVMWTLILERFWYFRMSYPVDRNQVEGEWSARADHGSWQAHQIRRLLISQTRTRLTENLGMIRTLVAVCPMLGLLGTVTGMIEVFDVMAAGRKRKRAGDGFGSLQGDLAHDGRHGRCALGHDLHHPTRPLC